MLWLSVAWAGGQESQLLRPGSLLLFLLPEYTAADRPTRPGMAEAAAGDAAQQPGVEDPALVWLALREGRGSDKGVSLPQFVANNAKAVAPVPARWMRSAARFPGLVAPEEVCREGRTQRGRELSPLEPAAAAAAAAALGQRAGCNPALCLQVLCLPLSLKS